ncbi:hypothetical protein I5M27_17225 [Adhaeribacter sp. BT258]|uniref:Uncharacterized protein n=1 Tax=Adhaeribacter terrigena TaxID=2793070 RepID=A0ABS1C5T7_9BACT|nr:hypothetical protein [Adhaeribacter terrigena]MBK0404739.1 hypothetical protein [Adhaeribacter terrigena]
MRTRVITLLVILFSFKANAQYYAISLEDYSLKQPIRDFKIHEFIDLRFDQSCIGMVQAGIRSKKMPADFESNFFEAFDTFLTHNTVLKQEPLPVILKVNKFIISERIETTKQYATASIALEFLAKKDSGYVKLAEVSSYVQTSSGVDVTNHHEENIVKALEECLLKFAAVNIPEKIRTAEIISADHLRVNSYYQLSQFNLPI